MQHRRDFRSFVREDQQDRDCSRYTDEDIDDMVRAGTYKMRLLILEFIIFNSRLHKALLKQDACSQEDPKPKLHAQKFRPKRKNRTDTK